ncbi:MAG: hypothetical protein WD049_01285 [Candidatus Paceibacterota bacterium]
MKLVRAMFLVGTAAGAVAVALGLTFGDANPAAPSAASDVPVEVADADKSTKAVAQEATLLRSEDLWDVHVPDHLKGFEKLVGSAQRGLVVLTERLSCLECHSIVPGEDTGYPDLSDVGRRLSPKQIVTSILEPSRELAAGYKSVMVLTTDGRMIRGVELESNDEVVVLKTSQSEESVPRNQIEKRTVSGSDMPEGLVDDLNPQEFSDLITFLSGSGRSEVTRKL